MIGLTETDNGTKMKVREEIGRIPITINNKARTRLEDVLNKIYEMALTLCPVDTGSLVSTIRLITDSSQTGIAIIGGGLPDVGVGVSIFGATITAGDSETVNPKNKKATSVYADLVHDGHFSGKTWVPACPFLTDAITYYEAELMAAVDEALKEAGAV